MPVFCSKMVNWWETKKTPYAVGMDVLNYDMGNLVKPCQETMSAGADYFHFDVQDGHYGPLISVGSPVVEGIRKHFSDRVIICHMLVLNPERLFLRIYLHFDYMNALLSECVRCTLFLRILLQRDLWDISRGQLAQDQLRVLYEPAILEAGLNNMTTHRLISQSALRSKMQFIFHKILSRDFSRPKNTAIEITHPKFSTTYFWSYCSHWNRLGCKGASVLSSFTQIINVICQANISARIRWCDIRLQSPFCGRPR